MLPGWLTRPRICGESDGLRLATIRETTGWLRCLTFGEGWHNNHHAHPTSARHGLAWYEIDLNWWGIRVMQFLRLAKGVRLVSAPSRAGS